MKGVRIEVVGWDEAEARVMPVRTGVFVVEQGVPEEIERDAFDAVCRHAIARDAEGRVVATSGALSALLGYRPEALVGHPLGDVLCAEDAEGERARYLAARAAGERSYTQAVDWRRADGTTVPGRLSVRFAASSDEVGDLSLALALLDELPFG